MEDIKMAQFGTSVKDDRRQDNIRQSIGHGVGQQRFFSSTWHICITSSSSPSFYLGRVIIATLKEPNLESLAGRGQLPFQHFPTRA
jgi:hypothetical protein